ncbi:hypothetical protein HMPREF9182_0858 [Streptococcus sp. oral taxon 056 str. F0418]|nr:hypothetical protein HMPREF9182_0858 [Streptococcus sp. oral taxon 056 str. F0418]
MTPLGRNSLGLSNVVLLFVQIEQKIVPELKGKNKGVANV